MKNKLVLNVIYASLLFFIISCKHDIIKNRTLITIKGSDSELNLVRVFTEKFKYNFKSYDFDLSGGGSKKGILALIDNETDIANSSRFLNDDEESVLNTRSEPIYPFYIASDVVCVISNPENGIDSISLNQLSHVLRGVIVNWKQLGGNDLPIKIFGRDNNSGTRSYLQQVMGIKKISEYHVNFKSNNEIISVVEKEKGAIGYVNVGSLLDREGKPFSKVWAMNIYGDGIPSCSPYQRERIRSGEYLLTRPLIQYITKPKKEIIEFIRFELDAPQQIELENHGYLKLNVVQTEINNRTINQIESGLGHY